MSNDYRDAARSAIAQVLQSDKDQGSPESAGDEAANASTDELGTTGEQLGETGETVGEDDGDLDGSDDFDQALEEAGEGEDGEDEEDTSDEDTEGDPSILELQEDQVVRLPDGTEVNVKDAALRQADYTRKTQELSQARRQMESQVQELTEFQNQVLEWHAERDQNRSAWVAEIAQTTEGNTPAEVIAEAVPQLGGSPEMNTALVAELIVGLAASNQLSKAFVETFGLTDEELQNHARQSNLTQRERRLEAEERRRREQEEQARAEEEQQNQSQQQSQLAEQYRQQWAGIVQAEGFEPGSEEETAAKRELVQFCQETGDTNLTVAWEALQGRKLRAKLAKEKQARQKAVKRQKRLDDQQVPTSTGRNVPPASGSSGPATAAALARLREQGKL